MVSYILLVPIVPVTVDKDLVCLSNTKIERENSNSVREMYNCSHDYYFNHIKNTPINFIDILIKKFYVMLPVLQEHWVHHNLNLHFHSLAYRKHEEV